MMFHAITFGPEGSSNKYWNYHTYHSTQRAAERWALENKLIGGTFGYVVIREMEDEWEIVDECGTEKVSISSSRLGKFKIQPADSFVIV